MLERRREDPQLLQKILWSDESTFKTDGYMNLHYPHEWHVENLRLMRQDRSQYRFKVNMWTGILNGRIIGSYEFPENSKFIWISLKTYHLTFTEICGTSIMPALS